MYIKGEYWVIIREILNTPVSSCDGITRLSLPHYARLRRKSDHHPLQLITTNISTLPTLTRCLVSTVTQTLKLYSRELPTCSTLWITSKFQFFLFPSLPIFTRCPIYPNVWAITLHSPDQTAAVHDLLWPKGLYFQLFLTVYYCFTYLAFITCACE